MTAITNEELWYMLEEEGMDYVLVHRINRANLEDFKTRRLADEVYKAMSTLESWLRDCGCGDDDYPVAA